MNYSFPIVCRPLCKGQQCRKKRIIVSDRHAQRSQPSMVGTFVFTTKQLLKKFSPISIIYIFALSFRTLFQNRTGQGPNSYSDVHCRFAPFYCLKKATRCYAWRGKRIQYMSHSPKTIFQTLNCRKNVPYNFTNRR